MQVATIQDMPAWGMDRVDTVYDAVMSHYTSLQAPGTWVKDYLKVGV